MAIFMVLEGKYSHALSGQKCLTDKKMTKATTAQLLILVFLLLVVKVSRGKVIRRKHDRKILELPFEKSARSALLGLKPEDVFKVTAAGLEAGGARKSRLSSLHQLPAIKEEQSLTNSAILYSGQLSSLDRRLVNQFDKELVGNHEDSSHGTMSKIEEGYIQDPSHNKSPNDFSKSSRNFVEKVTRDEMGRTEDMSTVRNGGLDNEFYRQISQIENDQPQASDAGKVSDMYKDNPLPEYSYKESEYEKMPDYNSKFGNNPFEMPKNYYQELDTQDKALFEDVDTNQEQPRNSFSDNSDLFSVIGKKVIIDLLNHRNGSDYHSEDLRQDLLKKVMGEKIEQNDAAIGSLLAHKQATTLSPFRNQLKTLMTASPNALNYLPTLPSKGSFLTSGKILSKSIMINEQQPPSTPNEEHLHRQEQVSQDGPVVPSGMKDQSVDILKYPDAGKTPSRNVLQSKETDSPNAGYVTLKISGAGKPVSFKAGTSNDGSLVLRIPGNVTLTESDPNKTFNSGAFLGMKEYSNSKPQMVTDAEETNRYLWESQTAPARDLSKKGNTIKGFDDNLTTNMLNWQILGKTNSKLNKKNDREHNDGLLHEAGLPAVSLTRGRNLGEKQRSPTAVHGFKQISPTKYNELDRISFAGVGQSPPPNIFPLTSRLPEGEEKHKFLSLKSFLRPSKFFEDHPENRARLSFRPDYDLARTSNSIELKNGVRDSWSPCSVTCGQGIQARAQFCQGRQCKGYRTESKACFMPPCPDQLGRAGLRLHNKFRTWHGSPPLKWSKRLASKAQEIAKQLADNSIHLSDLKKEHIGINVARLWHSYDIAAEKATAHWYSEVKSYNFDDPMINKSTKHFTQLIWRDSKRLGIGEAKSSDGKYTFVVALYDPPGNLRHKEKTNIHIPEQQS